MVFRWTGWNVTPPKQSKDICIRGPIGLVITNSATHKALDKCKYRTIEFYTINVGSLLNKAQGAGRNEGDTNKRQIFKLNILWMIGIFFALLEAPLFSTFWMLDQLNLSKRKLYRYPLPIHKAGYLPCKANYFTNFDLLNFFAALALWQARKAERRYIVFLLTNANRNQSSLRRPSERLTVRSQGYYSFSSSSAKEIDDHMDLVMPQDGGQSGLPNPRLMERLYEGGDLLGPGSAGTPPISDTQVWTLTHTGFTGSLGYRLKQCFFGGAFS